MRKTIATVLILAATATAFAAPRHPKHRRLRKASDEATEAYIVACFTERTGPDLDPKTGKRIGITAKAALKLCNGIAMHQARITKLAQKAAKAIEACQEEVVIACEDTTERSSDHGECSDATLRGKHAFDVCTGHGPAWVESDGDDDAMEAE